MQALSKINIEAEIAADTLLKERPEWALYLKNMVRWEQKHRGDKSWNGWVWQEVQTPITIVNSLITSQLVELVYKSRQGGAYRLADHDAVAAALEAADVIPSAKEPVNVDELFDLVVGQDKAKQLIRYAIKAEAPVHCLLSGPPGCAKTLILSDIARLPGAEMYVGSTTTKAGLVGLLLGVRPEILVLDEIDKMSESDMTPLLNLMETGMVTRLQHGVQQRVTLQTKVFAGANEPRRISQPILSRFAKFDFAAYSYREFVQVAQAVLMRREGLGPEMALHIATEVVKSSTDVRDAVRVARMARGDPKVVCDIVACLWPSSEPARVTPIRN